MCPDCLQIADEYAELLKNHQRAAYAGTEKIEELKRQLAREVRRADDYEKIAKLGYPEILQKWIDSQVRP